MKKYAVIVAGGSGARMGNAIPKQFLQIQQKPILYFSIKAFLDAFSDINIIVVLPKAHFSYCELIQSYFETKICFIEGGETRFNSVNNGLKAIHENGIVFVHDAVRCLITEKLIQRCYSVCISKGNAIPAIDCIDTMRQIKDDNYAIIDRTTLKVIQTPQTFFVKDLQAAFNADYQSGFTDEASVVEAFNQAIHLCEGESTNLKITTPIDLIVASIILDERI